MQLGKKIELLNDLGNYILENDASWKKVKATAFQKNNWFIPEFIDLASENIARNFLERSKLKKWIEKYRIPTGGGMQQKTGIIMAGNLPLVGFHDFLAAFISGNAQLIKLSSKDDVLLTHLAEKLISWDKDVGELISFSEMLKNCYAYIATGSNNSSRYFEYYFSKYPHIIRKNRTSIAVLSGEESNEELLNLADDVHQYFGLGCRNVTKIYAPEGYDFVPLLEAFKKYNYLADHHKYKNNYDYQLALLILNKQQYMTNGSILLVEDKGIFSPISQLHYEFYNKQETAVDIMEKAGKDRLQCVTGKGYIPFGKAQSPELTDYPDGVDTLQFLLDLRKDVLLKSL